MNNDILEIKDILNEYSEEVQDLIASAAESVAKRGANKLKNNSPRRTGKYAKGWKVKTQRGKNFINCTIHNSTNWQLTHLLEKPHVIRNKNGSYGMSKPQVHIAPVEEECITEFERNVENIIKNGG